MRKLTLIAFMSVFIPVLLFSQPEKINMSKAYRVWINKHKIVGILYQVNDSSLAVSRTIDDLYRTRDYKSLIEVDYKEITSLKICEIKKLRKGSLTGGIVGTLLGIPVGIMYGLKETKEINKEFSTRSPFLFSLFSPATTSVGAKVSVLAGILSGLTGGIIGAGVGYPVSRKSNSIIVPLDGTFDEFESNRESLKKYAYLK